MNLARGTHWLCSLRWYSEHQAWLKKQGLPHHTVKNDWRTGKPVEPKRLNIHLLSDEVDEWSNSEWYNVLDALSEPTAEGAILDGAVGLATEEEEEQTWAKVVQDVIDHPGLLEMDTWHGTDHERLGDVGWKKVPVCGTTHCLAGWAQARSERPLFKNLDALEAGVRLMPRHAHLFMRNNEDAMAVVKKEAERLGLTPRPHKHEPEVHPKD